MKNINYYLGEYFLGNQTKRELERIKTQVDELPVNRLLGRSRAEWNSYFTVIKGINNLPKLAANIILGSSAIYTWATGDWPVGAFGASVAEGLIRPISWKAVLKRKGLDEWLADEKAGKNPVEY